MAKKEESREEWEKYCRHHHRGGGLFFGLFILLIGVSWLGNEMHWWNFNLPWLPLAVTLLGISMVYKWMQRQGQE